MSAVVQERPHEDAYLRAWHDGEATIVHEVYLLLQDSAEVVLEQRAHVLASREIDRLKPPSLYVRIEQETCSAEAAGLLADALTAAARLMA